MKEVIMTKGQVKEALAKIEKGQVIKTLIIVDVGMVAYKVVSTISPIVDGYARMVGGHITNNLGIVSGKYMFMGILPVSNGDLLVVLILLCILGGLVAYTDIIKPIITKNKSKNIGVWFFVLLESLIGLGLCKYLWTLNNGEAITTKRKIKTIKYQWNVLMDSIGTKGENQIEQNYQILDIIPKQYGFDMITSLPYGKTANEFRTLIPQLSSIYKSNVIAEPHLNCMYCRFWENGSPISKADETRFKWYSIFSDKKYRNSKGETYSLVNGKSILNPLDETQKLGNRFEVTIPNELSYDDLKAKEIELGMKFGVCQINYNHKNKTVICDILDKRVGDKVQFAPIKVKPYQLFTGVEHNFNPIVLDYKELANGLVAGTVGTGKTVAVITAFINIINSCTTEEVELYFAMIGEKQDLAIFKNAKHTKYYAQTSEQTIDLLRYLISEMDRRNKLFQSEHMCFNVYRYNELVGKEKALPIMHFVSDELADLMEDEKIQDLLWNLIRKSRSAGIYLTLASQRFSLKNISPEVKAQLSNKICFKLANTASAMTVADHLSKEIVALPPKREFIADYNQGIVYGKTLYLSEEYMIELMKDHIEKDKEYIKVSKNSSKKERKSMDIDEKVEKSNENEQKTSQKTTAKKTVRYKDIK